jgi:hypothetical protein
MSKLEGGMILVGHYRYVPQRGEFIGAVASQDAKNNTMTVLTIGCEVSEVAILTWIKETIALMRAAGETNVQAADMYDRTRDVPLS